MTLKEAISLAEEARGSEVGAIKDCDDRWAFAFKEDFGRLGSAPIFIFKNDGRCEFFFVGDYVELLMTGKSVPLPK